MFTLSMASLRSFIFFYFMLVFTLFNSNWAEKSLNKIPCVPPPTNITVLDVYEEADMNTHALPAASKILKYSIRKEDGQATIEALSAIHDVPKRGLSVISEFVVCGVKAFLHLLQLF